MWKEKSMGESPGFWYENKVDVEAVPEIGTRGGEWGWEQIRKPTGLAGEQSGKSYRLVAVWMWTSRQSSKLYQGGH